VIYKLFILHVALSTFISLYVEKGPNGSEETELHKSNESDRTEAQ